MSTNVSNTRSDLLISAWKGLLSEAHSLDKLLNRNRSQHRVGKYYRSLERVRRALKSELGIPCDDVTVPAVYHLVEYRCEKLVKAPAGRAERQRRAWSEEAWVVGNHLMEATRGCDCVMGACLSAAAHLRILACLHGLAEALCQALVRLQMAAALVPEAKLSLLPCFCHLDNVRTSFKRVQERIAVFYQRRQQEKICGGNKPSLVEEEPEEIGMCIERSAGKMAATIPVPSAGTKADHCIKITDMSSSSSDSEGDHIIKCNNKEISLATDDIIEQISPVPWAVDVKGAENSMTHQYPESVKQGGRKSIYGEKCNYAHEAPKELAVQMATGGKKRNRSLHPVTKQGHSRNPNLTDGGLQGSHKTPRMHQYHVSAPLWKQRSGRTKR